MCASLFDTARSMYRKDTNPSAVRLRNPPQPYAGLEPTITISFAKYPNVVANIISFAGKEVLLAMRVTCKLASALVDCEYARHIEVSSLKDTHLQFNAAP